MPKHILLVLTAATLLCSPALAQEAPIETSLQFGGTYTDSVTVNDDGASLTLDDVKTVEFGLSAERELIRRDNLTLSGALSGQARFGDGNSPQLNGLTQTSNTDFRRLGAYADVTARMEGQNESDWTPFLSAGVGVAHDRITLDDQVFEDLSPRGRVQAGLEKKINDKATFGIGVGPSFKLD